MNWQSSLLLLFFGKRFGNNNKNGKLTIDLQLNLCWLQPSVSRAVGCYCDYQPGEVGSGRHQSSVVYRIDAKSNWKRQAGRESGRCGRALGGRASDGARGTALIRRPARRWQGPAGAGQSVIRRKLTRGTGRLLVGWPGEPVVLVNSGHRRVASRPLGHQQTSSLWPAPTCVTAGTDDWRLCFEHWMGQACFLWNLFLLLLYAIRPSFDSSSLLSPYYLLQSFSILPIWWLP